MDNLNYTYATCTNKHTQVNDGVSSTAYASYGFAPGQATGNYVYNVLVELEADAVNGKKYEYNSTGQISRILNSTNQPVAEYVYDESGQRMLKISYNGSTVVKTFYVRDGDGSVIAIHEQNGSANPYVLKELALSGDGREGTVYKQAGGDVYSYELTDHLGSTRAVIKEGALQTLAFSMDVVPATGNNLTYFTDNYTTIVNAGGNKVSRVLAPAKPEGVSTVLIPVKAGDVVQSRVYAAFTTVVSGSSINAWLVGDVLDENGNVLSTQGVPVSSSSYQTNVQYILNQSIVQNGYLRVYVKSNELFAVDFDDLQVQFSVGGVRIPEVMEAVAYYPHGSELPGLSYHSSLGGRYGYQGQYAERDKEVNEDFFELRNYNSLLGRFNTIDPYEQYWSPYLAMGNNHPNMVDPDGGFSFSWGGAVIGGLVGFGVGYGVAKMSGANNRGAAMIGAGAMTAGFVAGGIVNWNTINWNKALWYTEQTLIEYGPVVARVTFLLGYEFNMDNSISRQYRSLHGGTFTFDAGPKTHDRVVATSGTGTTDSGFRLGQTSINYGTQRIDFKITRGRSARTTAKGRILQPAIPSDVTSGNFGSWYKLSVSENVQYSSKTVTKRLFGVFRFSRTVTKGVNNVTRNGRRYNRSRTSGRLYIK